ncbi:MAG: ComF family protein [Candidatus Doudnabacteria bacterium]|nr:ComF family protein [Candidatus Doudnabacteria bacterium]
MSLIQKAKTLGRFAIDLVFPVSCVICGKEDQFLCPECQNRLPRLEHQKCIVCQKSAPFGKTHPACSTRNTADGLICALPYSHPKIENLIRVFKYKFISDLSNSLAEIILKEIKNQNLEEYVQGFIVVPVPLHKRRFAWRGFNQAQLLSYRIAHGLILQVDNHVVLRTKNTKPQTKLTREGRKANITDAFALNPDSMIAGKKFLLIDDVVTSGATMNEIAKLLKQNKAIEVWACAVAHG